MARGSKTPVKTGLKQNSPSPYSSLSSPYMVKWIPSKDNGQKAMFVKNLEFCSKTLDYKDELKHGVEKAHKLEAITELRYMLQNQKSYKSWILPNLGVLIKMIEKNIFRPLPKIQTFADIDAAPRKVQKDPTWPHVEGIYCFFLELISNELMEVDTLKKFIKSKFIMDLIQLFDSSLPEERGYLANILYKLYTILLSRRKMIRMQITDVLMSLIHEDEQFNGTSELLAVISTIIGGFSIPLKEEHVNFYMTVIIPLHKLKKFPTFCENLFKCTMLYMEKDNSLAHPLLTSLLRYWPFAHSAKEVTFLPMVSAILDHCRVRDIESLIPKLFKRFAKCLESEHIQVGENAICIFKDTTCIKIMNKYKEQTFEIIAPTIVRLSKKYFKEKDDKIKEDNIILEGLTLAMSLLKQFDFVALKVVVRADKEVKKINEDQKRKMLDEKWQVINDKVKLIHPKFQPPSVPFQSSNVIGEFNQMYQTIGQKINFN